MKSVAKYHVFLSHASRDKPAVEELAQWLVREGITPFLDKWELVPGKEWMPALLQAIEDSASCAVLLGPGGINTWQEREMQHALLRARERHAETKGGFRVIPVLLPGAKMPEAGEGGEVTSSLLFLNQFTWVEFGKCLDEVDNRNRLVCGIRGTPPGPRPGTTIVAATNPYRGLDFFDVAQASLFFGREKLTLDVVAMLRDAIDAGGSRLLAVVGPSGSGKSSVVRAGVIPALQRGALAGSETWRRVVMKPGRDPFENLGVELAKLPGGASLLAETRSFLGITRFGNDADLEEAQKSLHTAARLAVKNDPPETKLLVVVDQFEEIFTNCPTEDERRAFLANLLYAARVDGPVVLILTMRSDFFGKCAGYRELADMLSGRQKLVGPMTDDELRWAIEKPAGLAGGELEPGLVELLLKDVRDDEKVALPLLQFALKRLWDDKTGRRMTVADYRAIEGVQGALRQHAEAVLARLKGSGREEVCRQVFLALIRPGEGTEDTRKRLPNTELAGKDQARSEVIEQLVRERLLATDTPDDPQHGTVEVVHEALIQHWMTLRGWIDAERDDLVTREKLKGAAREWLSAPSQHKSDYLFTGGRLAVASDWSASHANDLGPNETKFLDASLAAEKKRKDSETAFLRKLTFSALGAVAVMAVVTALAVLARLDANIAHQRAVEAHDDVIAAQIENLQTAQPNAAASILASLKTLSEKDDRVAVVLREALKDTRPRANEMARVRLGALLVLGETEHIRRLTDQMLDPEIDLDEFLLIRDVLASYANQVRTSDLWKDVSEKQTSDQKEDQRTWFLTVAALAAFTPESKQWERFGADAAEELLKKDASELLKWVEAFRGIKLALIPRIEEAYLTQDENRALVRPKAADVLGCYCSAQRICELLVDGADSPQTFLPLVQRLSLTGNSLSNALIAPDEDRSLVWKILEDILAKTAPAWPVSASDAVRKSTANQRAALFRRQANAAATLIVLGQKEKVWKFLTAGDDPTLRTYLIDRFPLLGIDTEWFMPHVEDSQLPNSVRQAIILALGKYPPFTISNSHLGIWQDSLLRVYEHDADPGIHSAAEWTLNRWKSDSRLKDAIQRLDSKRGQLSTVGKPTNDRNRWYVNKLGQTMIIVSKPDTVQIGSPSNEAGRRPNEELREESIDWAFAMSANEISVRNIQRMANDEIFKNEFQSKLSDDDASWLKTIEGEKQESNVPATKVSWFFAAAYCNWLSEMNGLDQDQWCYAENSDGQFALGMKIKDWSKQKLTGYRLPLESEWEYACRAGTKTPWSCGDAVELLPNYARYGASGGAIPISSLKPNDWGLFDMHGNALEWCQDTTESVAGEKVIGKGKVCWLRGGSFFYDNANDNRSASRIQSPPSRAFEWFGFRVARTHQGDL